MINSRKLALVVALIFLLVICFYHPQITDAATTVTIDPDATYQTIEGWGASLCWWGNQIAGGLPITEQTYRENRQPIDGMDIIYSGTTSAAEESGHNHMRVYADIEGYQNADRSWNWNADASQRAVLNRLIERGKYYGSEIILERFPTLHPTG